MKPKSSLPQKENIVFCRDAIKRGARFVRVDALPNQKSEVLKSTERIVGTISKTHKGRILSFSLRFILEVNRNYDPEKDNTFQELDG